MRSKGAIKIDRCCRGLLLVLFVLWPTMSFANVSMRVTPNGNASFLLSGDNIVGVTYLDIVIDYDSNLLVNPKVQAEGGTVTSIYAGTPGRLLVGIDRQDPSAAFYLFLRFDNPGKVRGGKGVNSVTAMSREAGEPSSPDAAETVASPSSPRLTRGRNVIENSDSPVKVNMVVETNDGKRGNQFVLNNSPETTSPANTSSIPLWDKDKSVLQRFREFKGKKDLASFAALFDRTGEQGLQSPSIALSDGTTPVTITICMQQHEQGSPEIALWDAALVSMHRDGMKSWVITVVPSEGAWDAKLIFKVGTEMIECPLVVAPRVEIAGNATEHNFISMLHNYLSIQDASFEKGSLLPLNEYIFTANYLTALEKPTNKNAW